MPWEPVLQSLSGSWGQTREATALQQLFLCFHWTEDSGNEHPEFQVEQEQIQRQGSSLLPPDTEGWAGGSSPMHSVSPEFAGGISMRRARKMTVTESFLTVPVSSPASFPGPGGFGVGGTHTPSHPLLPVPLSTDLRGPRQLLQRVGLLALGGLCLPLSLPHPGHATVSAV